MFLISDVLVQTRAAFLTELVDFNMEILHVRHRALGLAWVIMDTQVVCNDTLSYLLS